MLMSERTYTSSNGYRFGYQGSEADGEIHNGYDVYNTEYRLLDVRLGRWFSADPLEAEHAYQSPYCSMDNNPISNTDVNGLEIDWGGGLKGFCKAVKAYSKAIFNKELRLNLKRWRQEDAKLVYEKGNPTLASGGTETKHKHGDTKYTVKYTDIGEGIAAGWKRFNVGFGKFAKNFQIGIGNIFHKIDLSKLGWGLEQSTSGKRSLWFAIALGDWERFNVIFTARQNRLRMGQLYRQHPGLRNPLIKISWITRNGHRNYIAIGTAIQLGNDVIRWHKDIHRRKH